MRRLILKWNEWFWSRSCQSILRVNNMCEQTFLANICEFHQETKTRQNRQYNTLMSFNWFSDFHASFRKSINQSNGYCITLKKKEKKWFKQMKKNLHSERVHMFILWLNSHIHRLDFGVVFLSFMRPANHSVIISYWSLKGRKQFRPNFFSPHICLVSWLGMRVRMWANVDACQQNTNPMCKYLSLKIRVQCAFLFLFMPAKKITSHCYDCCWCRFKTKYPLTINRMLELSRRLLSQLIVPSLLLATWVLNVKPQRCTLFLLFYCVLL